MMPTVSDSTFTDVEQLVDGILFAGCTFTRCRLIYAGGPLPTMMHCRFDECHWFFDGAAGRTLAYLNALYQGGLAPLVEEIWEKSIAVRQPPAEQGDFQ